MGYRVRLCSCGSGHESYELRDAAGIFCTFVCESCEARKRAGYDPAIFDMRSSYAATGEEADIGLDPYDQ